ncbi:PadR family transcriptional regulator [Streptomyces albidoflavus]
MSPAGPGLPCPRVLSRTDEAGLGQIKGGTVYPVLNRLEEAGLVQAEFRAAERGPGRRYYELTPDGRRALREQGAAWREFQRTVESVLDKGERDT